MLFISSNAAHQAKTEDTWQPQCLPFAQYNAIITTVPIAALILKAQPLVSLTCAEWGSQYFKTQWKWRIPTNNAHHLYILTLGSSFCSSYSDTPYMCFHILTAWNKYRAKHVCVCLCMRVKGYHQLIPFVSNLTFHWVLSELTKLIGTKEKNPHKCKGRKKKLYYPDKCLNY